MRPIFMIGICLFMVSIFASVTDVLAQSGRYSSWGNPDATTAAAVDTGGNSAELIKRLRALIDEAEKARAADPVFLKDLRDTLGAFETPWSKVLMSDSFADGDFERNPAWRLIEGKWWVEKDWGLRSAIEKSAQTSASQNLSGEDAAVAILGAILKQAAKQKTEASAAASTSRAVIALPQTITNAFSVTMEFTSWQAHGRFEAAVYQGEPGGPGYRMVYLPGSGAELLRVTSRGSGVMDARSQALELEDKKSHVLIWSRTPKGVMSLSVDGTEVLRATDRAFSDPFNGLTLVNEGGDYIIKSVQIFGTQ